MTDHIDDELARGEELDARAIDEILVEWVGDGDHVKAARALMGALPIDIGEAICELPKNGPEVFAGARTDTEPVDEQEIEFHITAQAFEPSYNGWTVQFQAIGAPRLAHQNSDPSLEAYVALEVADTSRQLTAGGSTSLARVDEGDELSRQAIRPLTGSPEGNILATGLGAASVDMGTVKEVPLALPGDAELLAAMKKSLEVHLQKVREERARLKVTEAGETYVGKRFKVRS